MGGMNVPNTPADLLQALQHVLEQCALGKKNDLHYVAATAGWLMLPALQRVTERGRGGGLHCAFIRKPQIRKGCAFPDRIQ